MKSDLENKLLAVVRVRGSMGVRRELNETMKRLNLERVNNLVLIYGTRSNIGMIKKVGDFVTYGEIRKDMLERLLSEKGGDKAKGEADAIASGKKNPKAVISIPIRLRPPKHGYGGIKHNFLHGGALGYRGEEISRLLERMV
ncbi:MAG: uL30 family ribosomal protein [Candidatus Marsarchaeota archaeon]|nr:uL30 family ribosomal protein [Candidatus Marsarchaeota archaeon]MCL5412803.1 uL30 family ribosomal protein [Candidatus Marsarchaeota archaeon]